MSRGSNGLCLYEGGPVVGTRQPSSRRGFLRKCSSDPMLFPASGGACRSSDSTRVQCFLRLHTFNGCLISTPSNRSITNRGYEKDAKVLITVTVEGSPGPIRTLVQLGTSVEDTIKLVVQKYREEGRSPLLPGGATSSFDLYVSYFSLQCLNRSSAIGETGSRSFYLRKSNVKDDEEVTTAARGASEIACAPGSSSSFRQPSHPLLVLLLPPFFMRKIDKIMTRIYKLFKILGCFNST